MRPEAEESVKRKRDCLHASFAGGSTAQEAGLRRYSQYNEDSIIDAIFSCIYPYDRCDPVRLLVEADVLAGVTSWSGVWFAVCPKLPCVLSAPAPASTAVPCAPSPLTFGSGCHHTWADARLPLALNACHASVHAPHASRTPRRYTHIHTTASHCALKHGRSRTHCPRMHMDAAHSSSSP